MTRHHQALESDDLAAVCPIFRDAERVIATPSCATAALSGDRCVRPTPPKISRRLARC